MYQGKYYFEENNFKLIYNDTFNTLKKLKEKSFDMIFADPPYFLSNNGITCSGGKMVNVREFFTLRKFKKHLTINIEVV